jgi:hypothetical protein
MRCNLSISYPPSGAAISDLKTCTCVQHIMVSVAIKVQKKLCSIAPDDKNTPQRVAQRRRAVKNASRLWLDRSQVLRRCQSSVDRVSRNCVRPSASVRTIGT